MRQDGSNEQEDYQIWVIRSWVAHNLLWWTIRHKWPASADSGNHLDSIPWTRNRHADVAFHPACISLAHLPHLPYPRQLFLTQYIFCCLNYIKVFCDTLSSNPNIRNNYVKNYEYQFSTTNLKNPPKQYEKLISWSIN